MNPCSYDVSVNTGGRALQWVERTTDNRKVSDSNPTGAALKLWQLRFPTFGRKTKLLKEYSPGLVLGPFYLMSIIVSGEVIDLLTCRRLQKENSEINP